MLDSQPWGTIALGSDGCVVAASARACAMLRMPIPIGAPMEQIFGFCLRDGAEPYTALEQGREVEIEGAWCWLKLTRVEHEEGMSDDDPYFVAASVAVVDISPVHRALDERIASLRFLSHDLRSPLNSIVALSQLQEMDAATFAQCGGMRQIGELARYALGLGENFLFSSVVGNLERRDFSRFDLRTTLRELVPQLEVAAVYRGVSLRLWLPDGRPAWVNGLRPFIARALQNLIDNAIQASPGGATVSIMFKQQDDLVEIGVKDAAGGLPGLHQKGRIDSFDELSQKTSKGFGLGLKLATRIVTLHGGTLHAEINEDGGTTFIMRLPSLIKQQRAADPAAAAMPSVRDSVRAFAAGALK
ncbi:sensor histidine kinase [Trinickia acidisoli]|uniref:sensor histidine kinase n=1 Tax=Trinickia acidisoli TaxID=2767482 RepID=UPI001A8CDE75